MITNDDGQQVLTHAEKVVFEWYTSLRESGMLRTEALDTIDKAAPEFGATYEVLMDPDFYYFLAER